MLRHVHFYMNGGEQTFAAVAITLVQLVESRRPKQRIWHISTLYARIDGAQSVARASALNSRSYGLAAIKQLNAADDNSSDPYAPFGRR